ncbi:hypothetical protein B7486_12655 [cyanobacterium TDX16]|nr:hypothetical protein B7486_12655 [cyanobacterium TDX16]
MNSSSISRAILGACLLAIPLMASGCSEYQIGTVATEGVTKEELRNKLEACQDNFEATIRRACDQLVDAEGGRSIKRLTLIWQMRVLPMSRDAINQDNPIAGLVDIWVLAVRMRLFLTEGDGKEIFGPYQNLAIDAAATCEEDISRLAPLILSADRLEATRDRINAVARDHPLRGEFSGSQVQTTLESQKDEVLQGVLAIPLVPFRWLGGIDESAQAIKGFTIVAAHLTDVVQGLAADARLQTQLLMLDAEDMDSVKSTLTSMAKISESSERLATVAEKLPEDLRRELSSVVEEIDARQAEIQGTLKEARELSERIESAGRSVAAAGDAWSGTAKSIEDMVASFRSHPTAPGDERGTVSDSTVHSEAATDNGLESTASASQPAPYDINDYRRTAEALTETATRLQGLVADLRSLDNDGPVTRRLTEVSGEAKQVLLESEAAADRVTDRAAWRGVQLILLLFTCMVAYRFLSVRLIRSRGTA